MVRDYGRARGKTRIWLPDAEALGLRMLSADQGDIPMASIVRGAIVGVLERTYGPDWHDQAERRLREHGSMRAPGPLAGATATPPPAAASAGG